MTQTQSIHEFFGWRHHPFADTRVLNPPFLSQHDECLFKRATALLSVGKSFVLTGPSGTGKSTLIQYLIGQLDQAHFKPVWLPYGGLNRAGLLRSLADALGVDASGRKLPLLVKLHKHLHQEARQANPHFPILVVDDAHLMERESLLDLCSLLVCVPKHTCAAALILIGDAVFPKTLTLQVMAPVRTRLTANFPLKPLGDADSHAFIAFRLQQAGASADLFDHQALDLVAAHCRGNRREIMNVATLLLEEAYQRREQTIGAQLVLQTDCLDFGD